MADMITRINAAMEGRYRIDRELGEGGMATVYLADDLKHERRVALKVLKPELAAVVGAERFLAEIKTTANLQHPHILPLFDSGEADSFLFYVMPYVEGETLRDRLDREKQLPVDEAVRLASDVAEALHAAHEQGVIHRDIKPANILLSKGRPLVADFGIALAVSAAGGGRLTETGLSLGTPYYMSPEQATADRDPGPQSDIYSLACVLYEMIAGDPPHTGSSAQAVLAHILTDRPRALTELRDTVPSHVGAAVARALSKVPADRFESAAAFAGALHDLGFTYAAAPAATTVLDAPVAGVPAGSAGARSAQLAWAVAALSVLAAGWGWLRPAPATPLPPTVRVDEVLETVTGGSGRRVEISPDGRLLVYAGGGVGINDNRLFIRRVDQSTWRPLDGTEGAQQPDFSPTSDWIVFNDDGALSKIPVDGGPVLALTARGTGGNPRWGLDGFVYVAGAGGVIRVPEAGGPADTLVADGLVRYASPLPDGSGVLYTVFQGLNNTQVALYDFETGDSRTLVTAGSHAEYLPTGHLVYGHGSQTLMAVPFDLDTHEVGGTPAPVLPGVSVFSGGATQFSVSGNGTAVYLGARGMASESQLVLVDLAGNIQELPVTAAPQRHTPRFSPDGRRIAFDDAGAIHVFDRQLGTNAPLTFGSSSNYPTWSPDGATLSFRSGGGISRVAVDGSSPPMLLLSDSIVRGFPHGWTPDGNTLAFRSNESGSQDLFVLDSGSGEVTPYLVGEWNEEAAALSPSGRWLAYASAESGASELLVRAFPEPGARHQVSAGGGEEPVWSPDGTRIYYRSGFDLMAADVTAEDDFELLGRETVLTDLDGLVRIPFAAGFDVHPDGDLFVFFQGEASGVGSVTGDGVITIAINWFTELLERLGEN